MLNIPVSQMKKTCASVQIVCGNVLIN